MAKIAARERALELRKAGNSIKSISAELSVSKSTVSVWCRNIALSERAIKKIAANGNKKAILGLMRYSEEKRKKRQGTEVTQRELGASELGTLTKRDIYCIGLGLYWGEGYKTGSQEFGFTNSNSVMNKFYIQWLQLIFKVKKEDLILRLSINESHKKRVKEVEAYWSTYLNIPLAQFTKTSLIKSSSKKIYKNHETHMGTLRIKVRRGTNLRRQVLGAIEHIYTPNSLKTFR